MDVWPQIESLFDSTPVGDQRLKGAIILHIFAAFYFFTLLAIVCNDYFLPSVECICEDLKITPVSDEPKNIFKAALKLF